MLRARLGLVTAFLLAAACVHAPAASSSSSPVAPAAPTAAAVPGDTAWSRAAGEPPPAGGVTALASRSSDAARAPAVPLSFVGAGSLEAHGPSGGHADVALERVRVDAETSGDAVETTVDHVFRNDSDERLEGTFRFPLPEGAILTGLALEIDGRMVPGEIVEREKARRAYEQTVDEMRDPALLEWQTGEAFKLRVFPIEAHRTKRVQLRFVTALHRSGEGTFFAMRPPAVDADHPAPPLTLRLDGRPVDLSRTLTGPTGERLVRVAAGAPEVVSEATAKGTYFHAHLRPFSGSGAPGVARGDGMGHAKPSSPQALIVLCDRSRSMLEARGEQARVAAMLLDALGPEDRVGFIAGDVRARALPGGLRPASDPAARAALALLDHQEPDGASDLGALLAAGGAMAAEARQHGWDPAIVYLGDAGPTWGETRAGELERVARESLRGAPLHVVLLGKTTDPVVGRALAAATHGRLLRPATAEDARRAAERVVGARATPRLDDVRLLGADGLDIPAALPATLFAGDDVDLAAFAPSGVKARDLTLSGTLGGDRCHGNDPGCTFSAPIALSGAAPAKHVAERWAAAKIAALDRDPAANKEAIVRTSLEGGVMSRFTSFLVLENEEAYERLQIERKAKPLPAEDARVSAEDLRADDDASASVTPDHLQPGDPEVRVRAPADAESVVVVFPFGETKVATYEGSGEGGAWVVRFLVDRHTPDGSYDLLVRITHAGGRVEILKLPYMVDTAGPHLRVTVRPRRGGGYTIAATQELTPDEIAAQRRSLGIASTGGADPGAAIASVLTDAKRVEVRTPDGQVLSLTHVRLGEFSGTWTPRDPASAHGRLRVVAVDRAMNESESEVEVP